MLRSELARLKEAAEVLAKHVVNLERHAADLNEVTDYKSATDDTKQRHAATVNRVNETDSDVLANPIAAALVERARFGYAVKPVTREDWPVTMLSADERRQEWKEKA